MATLLLFGDGEFAAEHSEELGLFELDSESGYMDCGGRDLEADTFGEAVLDFGFLTTVVRRLLPRTRNC